MSSAVASPGGNTVVTSVKSILSPVMTTTAVTVKAKDTVSSSSVTEVPVFSPPIPSTSSISAAPSAATTSIFSSIQISSAPMVLKNSANVVATTSSIFSFSTNTSTSAAPIPIFGAATTTASTPESTTTTASSTFSLPGSTGSAGAGPRRRSTSARRARRHSAR